MSLLVTSRRAPPSAHTRGEATITATSKPENFSPHQRRPTTAREQKESPSKRAWRAWETRATSENVRGTPRAGAKFLRKDDNWVEHERTPPPPPSCCAGEAGLADGVEKRTGKTEFFGINQESCALAIRRGRREIMSPIIISAVKTSAKRRNYRRAATQAHYSASCPSCSAQLSFTVSFVISPRIGRKHKRLIHLSTLEAAANLSPPPANKALPPQSPARQAPGSQISASSICLTELAQTLNQPPVFLNWSSFPFSQTR